MILKILCIMADWKHLFIKLVPLFPDLNLLDWSSQNFLAVALHNSVYLWDATQGDIILLMKLEREEDYVCSLSWTKEGSYLAIGTSDCKVQVGTLCDTQWEAWKPKDCLMTHVHSCILSCGMWKIRSVYAAWGGIRPESAAWAGMNTFSQGRAASSSMTHTHNGMDLPVWVKMLFLSVPAARDLDRFIIMTCALQTTSSTHSAVTRRRCVVCSGPQMEDTSPAEAMTTWCAFGHAYRRAASATTASQSAAGVNTKELSRWEASYLDWI